MVNHPNRRQPDIGDIRFVCWVTPADKVEAAARKAGWTPDGEMSANDLIEPDNYEISKVFRSLNPAVKYGVDYINGGKDWWGEARVYRQEYAVNEYCTHPEWLNRHTWIVTDGGVEYDHDIEA